MLDSMTEQLRLKVQTNLPNITKPGIIYHYERVSSLLCLRKDKMMNVQSALNQCIHASVYGHGVCLCTLGFTEILNRSSAQCNPH